jgi:cytochrome c-type biogenesis protein CcmF
LLLFAFRAPLMKSEFGFDLVSREILLLSNNVILVVAAASIFLGTLFPMVYQAITDDLISIGPPYFNAIFVPLMGLLVVFLAIGPYSRWKRTSVAYLMQQLGKVALAAIGLGLLLPLLITLEFSLITSIAVALAAWIVLAMLQDIINKTANKSSRVKGLRALSFSYYGMQTAHFGMAVMLIGVALTSNYSAERSILLSPGQEVELGSYVFQFEGTRSINGANYVGEEASFSVLKAGKVISTLQPQRRIYLATGTPSTEMAIDAGFLRDLFVTLGEQKQGDAWSMTIYVKPFVRWIWLGAIFMSLGGILAAGDKRYRRLRRKQTEASSAVPATQSIAAELQAGS